METKQKNGELVFHDEWASCKQETWDMQMSLSAEGCEVPQISHGKTLHGLDMEKRRLHMKGLPWGWCSYKDVSGEFACQLAQALLSRKNFKLAPLNGTTATSCSAFERKVVFISPNNLMSLGLHASFGTK